MASGRTDRSLLFAQASEDVQWAIHELEAVLAERVHDPHAQKALQVLNDAFRAARSCADLDPLTGLMNRAALDQALEPLLCAGQRAQSQVALLFMDLDGFKDVNDRHGHAVGDRLLHEAAARIARCVRDEDRVARYGGDEFVVLLEAPSGSHVARAIATRIVEALGSPLSIDGLLVDLSISIGVALFPDHGTTSAELLRRADAAMYRAKSTGGNHYLLWAPDLDDHSGSYAKFGDNQRSISAIDIALRRA